MIDDKEVRNFCIRYITSHNRLSELSTVLIKNNYIENIEFWHENKLDGYSFGHKLYWFVNQIKDFPLCPVCNQPNKSKSRSFKDYNYYVGKYCSAKCAAIDKLNKRKNSCIIKYGTENPTQCEKIKEKIKNTCIKKYNSECPLKCNEIKKKLQKTCLKKYGVDNISKLKSIKDKISLIKKSLFFETLKNNSFVEPLFKKDDYFNHLPLKWKCKTCNNIFETDSCYKVRCPFCFPKNKQGSNQENEVFDFIKNIVKYDNINIERHNRKIIPSMLNNNHYYELDIYIPELDLAFEYNGDYWHSEGIMVPVGYHKYKKDICLENNITLYEIWEHDWINLNKKNIICNDIKNIIKEKIKELNYEKTI